MNNYVRQFYFLINRYPILKEVYPPNPVGYPNLPDEFKTSFYCELRLDAISEGRFKYRIEYWFRRFHEHFY